MFDEDYVSSGYRMYHIVMYNLSPIQKGIQAGHAALEYVEEYGHKDQYKEFLENHKTWIILDGGGSEQIKQVQKDLDDMGVDNAYFNEPDLNNAMSCVTFLVPEEIYDAEYYARERNLVKVGWVFTDKDTKEWSQLTLQQIKFKNWLSKFSLAR